MTPNNAPRAIRFVTSGNVTGSRGRWAQPIVAAWPGGTAPEFELMGVDPFLAMMEDVARGACTEAVAAVLVVLGRQESVRTVDRLVEAMASANVAGVCLVEKPESWRPYQRNGVIFMDLESSPTTVAAMLYALSERQPAVDVLMREVSLAQRCEGGIRSEIDRIHEELHLAAAVQKEFTSAPLPPVDGLDFGVLFRPVNFVSGDIYNVRPLGDGKAAFFLADAVGHGVPAALLTMVLTSSLTTTQTRAGGGTHILEPSEVLQRLNDRLCQSCLGSGRFATALYGVVDGVKGEVKVAGAGHPLPVLLGARGAREVRAEGPLLGVFPDAEFAQETLTLRQGDALLLYTDGFEMAFPERDEEPGAAWGGRTYLSEMANVLGRAGDVSQSLRQLEHLLDEQTGSLHQADDVTALVISLARAAVGEATHRLAA